MINRLKPLSYKKEMDVLEFRKDNTRNDMFHIKVLLNDKVYAGYVEFDINRTEGYNGGKK